MSHHIVDFKKVSFCYPDGTQALNNINFTLTHGEALGIVGANGSGKTTLLLHANGFLLPQSGEVIIGSTAITLKTLSEIRRHVGVVFQNPDDQLFMPTVFEDVAFGPRNQGLDETAVASRVKNALAAVGGLELMPRAPHHLSLGQKSAVAIATVLAMDPDILVLDEPASSLDPGARRILINLLKGFKHTRIIASHDLDLILDICPRCIILKQGQVEADGPSSTILSDQKLLQANRLELPLSLQKRIL
jgi:cobalt/nickel transport system ATP-binding protein